MKLGIGDAENWDKHDQILEKFTHEMSSHKASRASQTISYASDVAVEVKGRDQRMSCSAKG